MNARDVISIFYPDAKARLGELVVDAFVHETHTFSSELTEHHIESGGGVRVTGDRYRWACSPYSVEFVSLAG